MLTHGNVVADFSGFLKVTEVNTLFTLKPDKKINYIILEIETPTK